MPAGSPCCATAHARTHPRPRSRPCRRAHLGRPTALRKDNTGYALRDLFIGSEGTLGIITGAVLKLFPGTQCPATAFVAVQDAAAALSLLALSGASAATA